MNKFEEEPDGGQEFGQQEKRMGGGTCRGSMWMPGMPLLRMDEERPLGDLMMRCTLSHLNDVPVPPWVVQGHGVILRWT